MMEPKVPLQGPKPKVVEEVQERAELLVQQPQELLPEQADLGPERVPDMGQKIFPKRNRKQIQVYGDPVTYALDVHSFRKYLGPVIHV